MYIAAEHGSYSLELGARSSEIGARRSEIGDRRSELGDRRSELGDRRSELDLGAPVHLQEWNPASHVGATYGAVDHDFGTDLKND